MPGATFNFLNTKTNLSPGMVQAIYEYMSKFAVTKIYFQEQDTIHELHFHQRTMRSICNYHKINKMNEQELLTLAKSGDITAMVQLVYIYDTGNGAEKDEAKAFKWCLQGAIHGSPVCLLELINKYKNGLGVRKNVEKAQRLESLRRSTASKYDIKKQIEKIADEIDVTISMPESLYSELSYLAAQQDRTISELIGKKITGEYFYDY